MSRNDPLERQSLRRSALVAMVQPTADRKRDQLARPVDLGKLLLGNGSFAIESLMRTGNVVILPYVFFEQAVQMPLVQHNHVIEQLPA